GRPQWAFHAGVPARHPGCHAGRAGCGRASDRGVHRGASAAHRGNDHRPAFPSGTRTRHGGREDSVMPIKLVVSDVDGTLVTPDKTLTAARIRAVHRLHEHGIGFTIVSSRPPVGIRMLVETLALTLPIGVFNGGAIVQPDLSALEQHLVPAAAARRSIDVLSQCDAAVWVFTAEAWLVRDALSAYVALERKTILAEPEVVSDFAPHLSRAAQIVGSATDFELLSAAEAALRQALGTQAFVVRSQPYYLDVTAPNVDKGTVLDFLSRRLAVAPESIAVLGDME